MTSASTRERRKTPRLARAGRVEISFDDPVPVTVDAELVEMSSTGFRASHECKNLDPGTEIRYQREGVSGRARVIWTHVLADHRVSGFLLL